jgi:hypothetical protein
MYKKIIESKYNLLAAIVSGIIASIETTAFFVSFIISLFLVFSFSSFIKNKYFIMIYPFLMFLCWLSSGGILFFNLFIYELFKIRIININVFSNTLGIIFLGICGAVVVLLLTKLFFKNILKVKHFLLIFTLIPIPYLLGLSPDKESQNSIFLFYFIFNSILLIIIDDTFKYDKSQSKT